MAVSSNFRSSFEELSSAYSDLGFTKPIAIYGSSGRHASQIINGLPVDLFLSADSKRPALVSDDLELPDGMIKPYALGRLVLYSVSSNVSNGSLGEHLSKSSSIAIANPRLAPYGIAAEEVLRNLVNPALGTPKIVQGENIGQAFNLVHAGGATTGLVSLSQALDASEGYFQVIPTDLHSEIVQDLLIINASSEVEHFLSFMFSEQGSMVIKANGYGLPR